MVSMAMCFLFVCLFLPGKNMYQAKILSSEVGLKSKLRAVGVPHNSSATIA